MKKTFLNWIAILAILAFALTPMVSAFAAPATQQAQPPYPLVQDQDEKGRTVTRLQGFDPKEFGGDDSGCTLKDNPDVARLNEEVGSTEEACKSIVEWSLKNGDETIASGFYAMQPKEWFRLTYDQANGKVRFVGSFWRVPQGWNAHMLSMDYAGDWQIKNPGLLTVVGLSPTDPWVLGLWQTAESQFDGNGSSAAVATSTSLPILPTATSAAPVLTATPNAVLPTATNSAVNPTATNAAALPTATTVVPASSGSGFNGGLIATYGLLWLMFMAGVLLVGAIYRWATRPRTVTTATVSAPVFNSLDKPSLTVGSPDTVETLSGDHFTATTPVLVNGTATTVAFVDAHTLKVTIPAALLATAGTVTVKIGSTTKNVTVA